MKLFEFNKPLKEKHPKYCNKIWEWLNDSGKVYFQRSELETLWRQFSKEVCEEDYADPEPDKLESFGEWLANLDANSWQIWKDINQC